jgi:hypothetical protein
LNWPWNIPEQVADPFPEEPPRSGRYAPLGGTTPFWLVYSRVTTTIRQFADEERDADVKEFLEYLIAGFYHEYRSWDIVSPEYFREFQRPRPLRLMALAYFHMGYDLPRTIAKALGASPPLTIDRNYARIVFLRLNPYFRPLLESEFKSYRSAGIMGAVGKVLPLKAASRVACYWLVQMRAVAWVHGEIIESMRSASAKADFENRLLAAVVECGKKVAKAWWNPIFWFAWWPAPTVAVVMPLLGFAVPHLSETRLLEVSAAGLGLIAAYFGLAYNGLVRVIEALGQEIT